MYAIICFDRPDSARLRDTHRAAHVQFLNANAARIVFGGPLKGVFTVVLLSRRYNAASGHPPNLLLELLDYRLER